MPPDPLPRLATPLALLLALASCGPDARDATITLGGRIDLFLDREQVELVEGFGGYRELAIEHDQLANPDRDAVALPLFRNCTLVWHVDAVDGGRFVTDVARLGVGTGADESAAELRLTALRDGAPLPGGEATFDIPPMPADAAARLDAWHEGPARAVELALPPGTDALRLQVASPLPIPPGANVALLSPRVLRPARRVPIGEVPLRFSLAERLATRVQGEAPEQPFAAMKLVREVDGAPTEITEHPSLPAWSAEGTFSGRDARMALALLGGATASIPLPLVSSDSRLLADLALDDRLPAGTAAELVFRVDGTEVARRTVDSQFWAPLALPLGDDERWRGAGHVLSIEAVTTALPEEWVMRPVPNFGKGVYEDVGWLAGTVRVGLADLRLARTIERARRPASAARPSVLVVHVETLRADVIGQRDTDGALIAPHLTALARAGAWHPLAVAPSPWTVPSTATLLTGLTPGAHGAASHHTSALVDDAVTLPERAREAGVDCAAVVTNDLLGSHAGWARGFSPYAHVPYANARQVSDLARSLLDAHAGAQQLLFLHYWDPHGPNLAPGAWRDRYVEPALRGRDYREAEDRATRALIDDAPLATDDPDVRLLRQRYLGDVAYLDHHVGALLRHLVDSGLAETTAVVFSADHGEEFFEHGMWGHGSQLFDESVRVPLVLASAGRWAAPFTAALEAAAPGPVPGDGAVVSTGGLFAEILALLGVPHDADAVLPRLGDAAGRGAAVVETEKGVDRGAPTDVDPLRRRLEAVRGADHLLVGRWPVEGETAPGTGDPVPELTLYDLAADPGATQPLPARGPAAEALLRRLAEHRAWTEARALQRLAADADMATLSKLGYVGRGGR